MYNDNKKERFKYIQNDTEIKESSLLDEHYINTTKFNVLNFESFLVLRTKVINNSEKLIYKFHFQEFIYAKSFYEVIFLDYKKKIALKLKNMYNQETFRLTNILFHYLCFILYEP